MDTGNTGNLQAFRSPLPLRRATWYLRLIPGERHPGIPESKDQQGGERDPNPDYRISQYAKTYPPRPAFGHYYTQDHQCKAERQKSYN